MIVETPKNKTLAKTILVMRVGGILIISAGWYWVRHTNKTVHYVLAGALLLMGTLLVSFSVGIKKAFET
jgi:hypothetical protein